MSGDGPAGVVGEPQRDASGEPGQDLAAPTMATVRDGAASNAELASSAGLAGADAVASDAAVGPPSIAEELCKKDDPGADPRNAGLAPADAAGPPGGEGGAENATPTPSGAGAPPAAGEAMPGGTRSVGKPQDIAATAPAPAPGMEEFEEVKDFSSEPLEARFQSKDLNRRCSAYAEAQAKMTASEAGAESSEIFRLFRKFTSACVAEMLPKGQDAALSALAAYLEHSPDLTAAALKGDGDGVDATAARGEVLRLVRALIEHKAIDKPKLQQLAPPIVLLVTEVCECPAVMKEILESVAEIEGAKKKTQGFLKKQIAFIIRLFAQILADFGAARMSPKLGYLSMVLKYIADTDPGIRDACYSVLIELSAWLGDISEIAKPMDEPQRKTLAKRVADLGEQEARKPKRLYRGEAQRAADGVAVGNAGGNGQKSTQVVDSYDLCEAVDVWKKLPKGWCMTKVLSMEKWKDKQKHLQTLSSVLEESIRLLPNDAYHAMAPTLVRLIKGESNIPVVVEAAKCAGFAARGLRRDFERPARQLLPVFVARINDKSVWKQNVLIERVEQLLWSLQYEVFFEELRPSVASKSLFVKKEAMNLLLRALDLPQVQLSCPDAASRFFHSLSTAVLPNIDDADNSVRHEAAKFLATLVYRNASVADTKDIVLDRVPTHRRGALEEEWKKLAKDQPCLWGGSADREEPSKTIARGSSKSSTTPRGSGSSMAFVRGQSAGPAGSGSASRPASPLRERPNPESPSKAVKRHTFPAGGNPSVAAVAPATGGERLVAELTEEIMQLKGKLQAMKQEKMDLQEENLELRRASLRAPSAGLGIEQQQEQGAMQPGQLPAQSVGQLRTPLVSRGVEPQEAAPTTQLRAPSVGRVCSRAMDNGLASTGQLRVPSSSRINGPQAGGRPMTPPKMRPTTPPKQRPRVEPDAGFTMATTPSRDFVGAHDQQEASRRYSGGSVGTSPVRRGRVPARGTGLQRPSSTETRRQPQQQQPRRANSAEHASARAAPAGDVDIQLLCPRQPKLLRQQREKGQYWGPDPITAEHLGALKDGWRSCVDEGLWRAMFSERMEEQLYALQAWKHQATARYDTLPELLDMLLKWLMWMMFNTNTQIWKLVLDVLSAIVSGIFDVGGQLTDREAQILIPNLLERSGHNMGSIREAICALLGRTVMVFPRIKVLPMLLQGLTSKNKRSVICVLTTLCDAMDKQVAMALARSQKDLIIFARLLDDKDVEVRRAAVQSMAQLSAHVDPEVFESVFKVLPTSSHPLVRSAAARLAPEAAPEEQLSVGRGRIRPPNSCDSSFERIPDGTTAPRSARAGGVAARPVYIDGRPCSPQRNLHLVPAASTPTAAAASAPSRSDTQVAEASHSRDTGAKSKIFSTIERFGQCSAAEFKQQCAALAEHVKRLTDSEAPPLAEALVVAMRMYFGHDGCVDRCWPLVELLDEFCASRDCIRPLNVEVSTSLLRELMRNLNHNAWTKHPDLGESLLRKLNLSCVMMLQSLSKQRAFSLLLDLGVDESDVVGSALAVKCLKKIAKTLHASKNAELDVQHVLENVVAWLRRVLPRLSQNPDLARVGSAVDAAIPTVLEGAKAVAEAAQRASPSAAQAAVERLMADESEPSQLLCRWLSTQAGNGEKENAPSNSSCKSLGVASPCSGANEAKVSVGATAGDQASVIKRRQSTPATINSSPCTLHNAKP